MNALHSRVLKMVKKGVLFSGLTAGLLAVAGPAEAVLSVSQTYAPGKPFFNALTLDDLNCNNQPIWQELTGGIFNNDCGGGTRGWLVSPPIDATNVNFNCYAVLDGTPSGPSCGTCWAIGVSGGVSGSRTTCVPDLVGNPTFALLGTSALPVPLNGSLLFALDIRAGKGVQAVRWIR
jgi:hypothetical protein